ncbi:microtubule-associated protein futsch-like [Haliotis rufescens]|uniref:microtubule-associated protein futsch-like n=1 Tax=Haliotis rufescens TaxID=6454 RepID=UPI00201EB430|nr:microtubule-associated protein futsch-like [Haliotis rufescens]
MADDVVQEDDFDLYTDMICEESKLALEACRSLPTSVPLPVSPLGPSPDLNHLSPDLKPMSPDLKPSSPDLKPPSSDLKPLSQDSKPQFLVPSKPPPEEESVDLYSDIIADYPRTEKSSSSDNKVLASSSAGLSSRTAGDGGAAARSASSDKPGEEDSSLDLYTEILSDEVQQRHDSRIQLEQKYSTAVARIQDLEAELNKLKESEEKARTQNIVIKQNITSLLLTSKTELKRKDREITRLNLLLAKRGGGNFRGNHTDVRKYNESSPSRQKVTRMSDEYTDGQTPRRGRNSEYDNQKRKRNEQVNDGTPKRRKVGNSKCPVTPEPKDRRKPWSHSQSPDKPDRKKPVLTQKGRRNDGKYSDQRRRECAEEERNIGRSSTSRERDQRRRDCAEEGGNVGRSSTSRERDQRRRDCAEEGGNVGRSSTSRERDQRRRECAEEGGNVGRSSTSRERDHCDGSTSSKSGAGQKKKYDRNSHERDKCHEIADRDPMSGTKRSSKDGHGGERTRMRNKSIDDDKEKKQKSSKQLQNSSVDLRTILKQKRDGKGKEQKSVELANRKRHPSKTESTSESSNHTGHSLKTNDKEPRPGDKDSTSAKISSKSNDNNFKADKPGNASKSDENLLKNNSVKAQKKYVAEASMKLKPISVEPQTDSDEAQDRWPGEKVRDSLPSASSASCSVMKGESSNSPTDSRGSSSSTASKEKKRIRPIMLSGKPDVAGDSLDIDHKSCFDSVIQNIEMRENSSFANARVVVMDVKGCPVDASESTASYENQISCKDGATQIRDDAMEKLDDEYDRTCIKNSHDMTPSKHSGQVSSSNDLDSKLAEISPLQSLSKDKEQIGREENEQLPVCTGDPLLTETCVSADRETMASVVGDMSDRDCSLDLMMEEERCSRTMPYIHVRRNKCRNEVEQLTCSNGNELSNKQGQGEDSMDVSSGKKKKSKKKHRPKLAEKENVLSDTEGRCADVTKSDLSGRISPVTTEVSSHTASASVRHEMNQSAEMAVTSSDTNDEKLSDNTHERKDAKIDHVDRRDPRLNYESGSEHSVKRNFKLCQNSESVTNENNCVKIRSETVSTDKLSFHQCEDAGDNGSHVDGPLPIHLVDSRLNGHERPPYHVEPFDFTSFPKSYARSESEDEERQNVRNVECCGISEQRGVKKSCPENSLCDRVENAARDNDSDDIIMKEDECDENTEKKARHYSGSNDVEMEDTSTLSQMTKDLSGNVRQPLCRQSSVPAQGCNDQNVSIDLVKVRARSNSESQCSSSLPGSRPCSVPVECSQCTFQPVDLSVRSTVRSQFTESSHFRGFSMSEDGALDLSKKQIQRPFQRVNFESKSFGPKINPTLTNQDEPKSDQISSTTRMPASSQRTISYTGCLDKKSSTLVDLRTTKSNVEASDACDLVLDRQIKVEKDVEVDSSQHQVPPQLTQDAAAAVEVKQSCQEQEEPTSSDKPVNVSIQSMDRSDTSKECDLTSPERRDNHENKSDESSTFDSEGEEDITPSTSQDLSEPSSKTVSLTQVSSCSDKLKTICSSETMTTISSVPSKTTTSSYDSSASADDDGGSVSSSKEDKDSSEDDKDSSEEDDKESEEESSEDVCVTDNDDVYHCESSQSEILMKTLSCESLPLKNFEKLRHDLLLSDDSSLSYNHESSENLLATASRSHVSNDDEAMFKLPDMSTSAFARLASSSEPSDKTKSPETITRRTMTSLDEDTESSLLSLHAEQFEFDCDQSAHGDQFRSQGGQTAAETCVEEHEDGKSGECSEDAKSDSGECSEDGEITSDEEGLAVEAPIDEELSVDLRELLKAKQLLEQKINGICGRESKKPLSSRTCDRENRHKNQRRDRRLERKVDRSRSSRSVDNRRGSKPSTSEQDRFSREVHGSDPRLVGRSSSRHRRDEEARYHSSPSARQIPSESKRDSHRNTSPVSSRSSHRDHSKENHKSHGSDRQDKYQRPDRMVTDTGRHRARGRDFTDSVRSRGDPSPVSRHSGRRSNRDKS